MSIRAVKSISQSLPTLEGAGVKLRRAFGFGRTNEFDPFLLLDDFRNEHPEDYLPGFPWHPHRGIETITYVLSGSVTHGDSLGNKGTMGAGDVQWMTAGRVILHEDMPKGDERGRTDRVSPGARDAGSASPPETGNRSLVLFESGDEITVQAGEQGMRFLLVSGQPLQEPVAWQGPIVMNTQDELQRAYDELRR